MGQTKHSLNQKELIAILKTYGVDYYLVWEDDNFNSSGYKEITSGKIKGLKVYELDGG